MRAPAARSPRAGPALHSELVRLRTADLAAAALPSISVERVPGGGAGLFAGDAVRGAWGGASFLGALELRVRGRETASRRSKWNSEREKVTKRRVPRLPACPVRAAPPRGLLGTGKAAGVR